METKKQAQHNIYKEVRSEVATRLKKQGNKKPLTRLSFNKHLPSMLDRTGRTFTQRHIQVENNESLQDNWASNKENYPFITAFIKGLVFAGFYAAIE